MHNFGAFCTKVNGNPSNSYQPTDYRRLPSLESLASLKIITVDFLKSKIKIFRVCGNHVPKTTAKKVMMEVLNSTSSLVHVVSEDMRLLG